MKFVDRYYANAEKAVAYQPNFHYMAFGYDNENTPNYFAPCCEKGENEYRQIRDYEMPRSRFKKEYAQLDLYQFAVNESLRDELIAFQADPDIFRPVWTRAKDTPVCYQIVPKHIMLPTFQVNGYKKVLRCPHCGLCTYDVPEEVSRRKPQYYFVTCEALDDMQDFNYSYEIFGSGNLGHELVINKRIYEFLSDRYPRMQFIPLFLPEETALR